MNAVKAAFLIRKYRRSVKTDLYLQRPPLPTTANESANGIKNKGWELAHISTPPVSKDQSPAPSKAESLIGKCRKPGVMKV